MNADHFETRAIHAGQEPDSAVGAVVVPIYQTSTYAQTDVGAHKGYDYSRTNNPTRQALEVCLASLEGAANGLCFASGMGAITTIMLLLQAGDHVVVCDDVYGGTYRLFRNVLENYQLQFTFVDMTDLNATARAFRPNTRMVWLETPTNPLMKVIDIAGVAKEAKSAKGAKPWVVVDNTFASPYLQQPLALGADVVMHSTTKYLGGHSDVVGGGVVTSDPELFERLKFLQNAAGAVPGAFDCWLVLRGVKTLALRMERHSANALAIARFLAQHPAIARVMYPGLESHPQYEIAQRQMRAPGGMLSFIPVGGVDSAMQIARATRLFTLGESLGGVESLIEVPAAMTHQSVAGSPLEVDPALVRLSVGIENGEDLIADLQQALHVR
ncbi:MAG: cystathionine gamma-synthase [Chloroflexi bacterium]|nr:cystathionine gamma-synthase [Chloroflexota bacterium]